MNFLEGELIPNGVVAENSPIDLLFLLAERQVENKLFDGRFFSTRLSTVLFVCLFYKGGREESKLLRLIFFLFFFAAIEDGINNQDSRKIGPNT